MGELKQGILVLIGCGAMQVTAAQKIDSIFFHLYTDSLKKGTFNYINIDGKLSNGHWLPLTEKEIFFSASAGSFDRNSLFVDSSFTGAYISVIARLKTDTSVLQRVQIPIKKLPDTERLKTSDEILQPRRRKNN